MLFDLVQIVQSPFAISNYHDVNFDIDSICNHSIVKVNVYDFILV